MYNIWYIFSFCHLFMTKFLSRRLAAAAVISSSFLPAVLSHCCLGNYPHIAVGQTDCFGLLKGYLSKIEILWVRKQKEMSKP